MADFAESVFNAFRRLQDEFGFVAAGDGRRSASLVRVLTDDVAIYLFVHDGRSAGADLVISLWIAPPDEPDDGLDNLMIGFKILVASTFEVDDKFFELAQKRIIRFLPYLRALAEPVSYEFANPDFHTLRYEVYRLERTVYDTLRTIAEEEPTGAVSKLFKTYSAFAKERESIDEVRELDRLVAAKILSENRLGPEAFEFYRKDVELLAVALSRQFYIHALLERSAELLRRES